MFMNMKIHRTILLPLRRLFVAVASFGYLSHAAEPRDTMPDTWATTDERGPATRELTAVFGINVDFSLECVGSRMTEPD